MTAKVMLCKPTRIAKHETMNVCRSNKTPATITGPGNSTAVPIIPASKMARPG